MGIVRSFVLHSQCANCQKPSTKVVQVPDGADVPTTVEEFIETLEYRPVPFQCRHCESLIGELVGITLEKSDVAA